MINGKDKLNTAGKYKTNIQFQAFIAIHETLQ